MKNTQNRDMMVGGLVVLILAGLFTFSYAGKKDVNVGSYPVTAVFNRVDGLFEGDEVRMGGIRIGTVGQQLLDRNFRAVVTLNLNTAVSIPIDSAAGIHTDGLFGSKFVVLEPGVEDAVLVAGSDIENTQGAVVVSELLELIIDQGRARQASQASQASQGKSNAQQEGN